jgi:hypothetical protein
MWFLVSVEKGSRQYQSDSPIGNRVLVSDSTEMVISGRESGEGGYRFEARRGNETFIVSHFKGPHAAGALAGSFLSMAQQMGAVVVEDRP